MAKQREKFLAGAAANGVAEERAIELFDLIAFFAGYGFNKCLVRDTEVIDATTGERTTVGDLYDSCAGHSLFTGLERTGCCDRAPLPTSSAMAADLFSW